MPSKTSKQHNEVFQMRHFEMIAHMLLQCDHLSTNDYQATVDIFTDEIENSHDRFKRANFENACKRPPTTKPKYHAWLYDFSHDTNGNPNARFTLFEDGQIIHHQKRREQCGYDSSRAEAIIWRLKKMTNLDFMVSNVEGDRTNQINVDFKERENHG